MMNWRKPIIFGLLYLSGSNIPKYLKEIKRVDNLPKQKAKEYQDRKLKRLLFYAFRNVPYYHEVLKPVIDKDMVKLDNFDKIPILTKEIIRKEAKNLCSKEKRKGVYENTSGGSTGEPVRFLQDKEYNDWNIANKIWIKLCAGQDIGQRELRFWGSERDLLEGKEKLSIRLRNWLYNRKEFNTFRMSKEEMFEYVKKWNDYKPQWVEAYVQSIYEFANFIVENDLEIYSPKNGILTSAGTLYPHMKNKIEKVFRCKVYNRYGSREVGDIAFGTDSLKISFWNQKVESITQKGISKLIVTNLNNFTMPLIRYDIGDIGVLNDFNELKEVKGRENSIIKTNKGVIDSAALTTSFYYYDSFKRYQFIQKTRKDFLLKVEIVDKNLWQKEKPKIKKKLLEILGEDINIAFKDVEKIKPQKNGKFQYVVSEIK